MVILFTGLFSRFYFIPRSNADASNLNSHSGFHIKTKSTCLLGFGAFPSSYCRQRHSAKFAKPKSCILLNLILLCGDVNVTHGPNWKYRCGLYKKPVKSNQRGIQCDSWWIPATCKLFMLVDLSWLLHSQFCTYASGLVFKYSELIKILMTYCLTVIILQGLIQQRVHRSVTWNQN